VRLGTAAGTAALLAAWSLASMPAQATGAGPGSPLCVPRTAPARAGLAVVSDTATHGDPRLRDVTLRSAALGPLGTVHVEVLLPRGYDPAAMTTRYPVLYLLHGHGGGYGDWAAHGIEQIADPRLIVVMPDGGYDGFYSDWYGTDIDGHNGSVAPGWETFHIDDLLPWVDANFNTLGTRAGRAIAGLSMGGFGSMSYAARHPDLFSAAGAFSGAVDSDLDAPVGSEAQILASNLPDRKLPDNCIWGDPVTQAVVWRAHDPTELAPNLSDVPVSLWSGNGEPGDTTAGAPAWNPGAGATEAGILQENQGFIGALHAAGQQPFVDLYGPGTHDWFYWERDLRAFLARLPGVFWTGHATGPVPPAVPFSYQSAEPAFSVWGWSFRAEGAAPEFTYLTGVTDHGFVVRGSGSLAVVMAVAYRPGMTVSGGAGPVRVTRDARTGHAAFVLDLGPGRTVPQSQFGPGGAAATFPTAYRVTIR